MKLSKLSQRLLAPIAASFTLLSGPAFAKTEIDGKSFALGLQASLFFTWSLNATQSVQTYCYADKGYMK